MFWVLSLAVSKILFTMINSLISIIFLILEILVIFGQILVFL